MPTSSPSSHNPNTFTGDATGATTARDATDVIGVANPDTESTFTAVNNTNLQLWGHRRFVSRPLAAQTIALNGTWTFSYARSQSNANHNGQVRCDVYVWRPGTGAQVGTDAANMVGASGLIGTLLTGTTETADSVTQLWGSANTIQDGDILVFDVFSLFQQGMSAAYTEQFAYDGTTEASASTCASFVTPPSALTLFTGGPEPVEVQPHPQIIYLRQNR